MDAAGLIYQRLPVWAQNVAFSLYGYRLRRRRYGPEYAATCRLLLESEQWSQAEIAAYQTAQLRSLLAEAQSGSAYYGEVLGRLPPRLIAQVNLRRLAELPPLDKDTLRKRTAELVSAPCLAFGVQHVHTSGTTGTPINIPYDSRSLQRNFALRDRQYRWAGIRVPQPSCRFSGRLLMGKHEEPPFWRYNRAERQWFFSTYHMREENLELYAAAVQQLRPVYLDGYPSSLSILARHIVARGRRIAPPQAVFTTAETLLEEQREVIAEAFGCPVYNFYSSSEGAPFIVQCEAGNYHACPISGIIEVLRPDGQPAAAGEVGEMVVTSFFQRTVPLIRYRIGDAGAYLDEPCRCARTLPRMAQVVGRMDDILLSPQRGPVGRLDPVFKRMPSSIREAQIAQTAADRFELRYVADADSFRIEHLQSVCEELQARLGSGIHVVPQAMAAVPRGANGKFRAVVREWAGPK